MQKNVQETKAGVSDNPHRPPVCVETGEKTREEASVTAA